MCYIRKKLQMPENSALLEIYHSNEPSNRNFPHDRKNLNLFSYILSRASEAGSPTNRPGTGPGILWSVHRWTRPKSITLNRKWTNRFVLALSGQSPGVAFKLQSHWFSNVTVYSQEYWLIPYGGDCSKHIIEFHSHLLNPPLECSIRRCYTEKSKCFNKNT